MTEYKTSIVCDHGDKCPWLDTFRMFMDMEFVPKFLCDCVCKISATCSTKTNTNMNPVNDALHVFEATLRNSRDRKMEKEVEIKTRALEAMQVILGDAEDKTEQLKALIGGIITAVGKLQYYERNSVGVNEIHFTKIRDKLYGRPIFFQARGRMGRRRQRECDFEIDIGDDHTMERHREYRINADAVGVQGCPHSTCIWKQVWNFMQEMTGQVLYTAVPYNVCLELRKTSNALNATRVVDVGAGGGGVLLIVYLFVKN